MEEIRISADFFFVWIVVGEGFHALPKGCEKLTGAHREAPLRCWFKVCNKIKETQSVSTTIFNSPFSIFNLKTAGASPCPTIYLKNAINSMKYRVFLVSPSVSQARQLSTLSAPVVDRRLPPASINLVIGSHE